jgi:hypothetical protein
MAHLSDAEMINWMALYTATALCCAIAMALAILVLRLSPLAREGLGAASQRQGCGAVPPQILVAVAEALSAFDARDARDRQFVRIHVEVELIV